MHTVKRDLISKALTGRQPLSWKTALKSVLGAPRRVHHYRDIHTSMLREALCNLDCGPDGPRRDDE